MGNFLGRDTAFSPGEMRLPIGEFGSRRFAFVVGRISSAAAVRYPGATSIGQS
jgi:hypothetical protein